MDPLTQGVLGASVGQALYGRALGRQAVVWGALVGMSPDLDVVLNPVSPMAEWLWHRGPTHALWFGPVVGPLMGWLLWRWKGGSLRDWIGLAVAALFTHPLLDVFTAYGTQLLAPFCDRRFALQSIGIIDPAYTVVLAAALVAGRWWGFGGRRARRAAWAGLALTTAYLLAGLEVNRRAEVTATEQLRAIGVRQATVDAYPTLLQLPLRRVVARKGHEVRVGWLSVLAPRPIEWSCFETARGPLVEAARETWEADVLEWFAMGQTAARVEVTPEGSVVEIDDLRYGFPGRPREGLWGVRVRLDPSGRPNGPGERFNRVPHMAPLELLSQLWQGTLGASPEPTRKTLGTDHSSTEFEPAHAAQR